MLGYIIQYFYPIVREDDKWCTSSEEMEGHIEKYLYRSAIPTFLFWGLDLIFMQSNLLLAAICLCISMPFAWSFGLLLREYLDLKKSQRLK